MDPIVWASRDCPHPTRLDGVTPIEAVTVTRESIGGQMNYVVRESGMAKKKGGRKC